MNLSNMYEAFPFKTIIDHQLSFRENYKKGIDPPNGGICIVIKNNNIHKIISGKGWIHPSRKEQYVSLIKNCLKRHNINDCNININLGDTPIQGVFNFCRVKNSNYFLLPNHRFTNDDIVINGHKFNNYDEQKIYFES